MVVKFFQKLAGAPFILFAVVIAITAFSVYQAKTKLFDAKGRLIIDSTVEPYMARGSGTYAFFKDMQNVFGNEQVLVIALKPKSTDQYDFNFFLMVDRLEKELKQNVPDVKNVSSITNTPQTTGACSGDSFFHLEGVGSTCNSIIDEYYNNLECVRNKEKYRAAMAEDSSDDDDDSMLGDDEEDEGEDEESYGEEEVASTDDASSEVFCTADILNKTESDLYIEKNRQSAGIFEKLKKHKIVHRDLISPDGETVALVLEFKTTARPSDPDTQEILQGILEKYKSNILRVAYSAGARSEYLSSKTLTEDMAAILPISLILMMGTLFISFKSIRGMIIPLLTIVIGMLWTFGGIALFDFKMNTVTMIIPPLLISVGSAYIIHFINQYFLDIKHNPGMKPKAVTQASIAHITVPLTVTALTTLAGFAALIASPIPAVKDMGIWACVGIAVVILLTLTLVPAILSLLKIKVKKVDPESNQVKKSPLEKLLDKKAEWIGKYSKQFVMGWIVIGLISFAGLLQVTVNSQFKEFGPDTPIEMDNKLILEELAGTDTLRVIFTGKESAADLQTAETMYGLMKLEKWLLQEEGKNKIAGLSLDIHKVYSAIPYLDIHRNGLDNVKDEEVVSFFKDSKKRNFPKYLSDDKQLMQMNIRMDLRGETTPLLQLRELIDAKVSEYLPKLNIQYTGSSILGSETADNISRGQITSVSLALVVIFIIMSLMFFSVKMGIIALYPNIIAIGAYFGTLGWLDIPIGVTISVIASIALGIGVDDTIHFLAHHNKHAKKLRDERKASMITLIEMGKPMVFTSISLGLGFSVFMIANMNSQVMFGILTAYTLMICLVTDTNFTPAIMARTKLITAWDYLSIKLDKEFLRTTALFKGMSEKQVKLATLSAFTVDLEKGDMLYKEKDSGNEAYIILKGKMELFYEEEFHGKETVISQTDKGGVLGVRSLFREATRTSSARATEQTQLLVVNKEILTQLQKRYPKVAMQLFKNFASTLARPIKEARQAVAGQRAQVLLKFADNEEAYMAYLKKMVDDIIEDGVLSPDERQELEKIIYADGEVSPEEQEQLDRLNKLIQSGEVKEEKSIKDLVDEIIEDGVIDPNEREILNQAIYADHHVSPEEQEQIDRLEKLLEEGTVTENKKAFDNIFQNMSQRQMEWIRKHFEVKTVPADVRLYTQGDYGDYMLVINKGKFNIQITNEDGTQSIVSTAFEGDVIGGASMILKDNIRENSIISLEESEVIFMSMKELQNMENKSIRLAARLYYNMVCMLSDHLENCLSELYG